MPALRFFKIGVDLDMVGGRNPGANWQRREPRCARRRRPSSTRATSTPSAPCRAISRPRREPFASSPRPGFTTAELLANGHAYLETGQMRRYAAVLPHRNAGFVQNGMGVWRVARGALAEMRQGDGRLPRRVALLQRPTYPDWPCNLSR